MSATLLGAAGTLAGTVAAPAASAAPAFEVRDGEARFQVLSPTLFRLEYAADGNFTDAATLTAVARDGRGGEVQTLVEGGVRVIRTSKATLSYRIGSGPFGPSNLTLQIGSGKGARTVNPAFGSPSTAHSSDPLPDVTPPIPGDRAPRVQGNLGGWFRGLDGQNGAVPLHDGILSRDGWYLLDDTISPLLVDGGRWYAPRPQRTGAYQDGYLFAYGRDYAAALRDFRALTGPAPLLPRTAFGNWFSQYTFFTARSYEKLLRRFRAERVPLDVLVVDTDFKAPNPWNGWGWTSVFAKSPPQFLRWAHSQGLDVALNIHPSITPSDPAFPKANEIAGGLGTATTRCRAIEYDPEATCSVWDWARREHASSYFSLHEPFESQGVDFWWLDWNGDESDASAPGLTPDSWINSLYAQRSRERGKRWPVLSRIGSSMWNYAAAMPGVWSEHRSAIHFTGDAFPTWPMLDFQIRMTTAEGAGIGLPYVSHDIGSFHGRELRSDMYIRWIQFGAFQPILRLHSDHGERLPWQYGARAERIASGFLRLRGSLVPYLYTLARQAYDTGMPLARPMYVGWPRADAAYRFDGQYMLGDSLLVAPVAKPGKRAAKRIWFPPGKWVDTFTGAVRRGPGVERVTVPLERMPVFARAGSIVPRQVYTGQSNRSQARELTVDVYPGANGRFTMYEDSGDGLGYERGEGTRTKLRWKERRGSATLAIGKARGGYPGQLRRRRYEVSLATKREPDRVLLEAGGKRRELRSRLDRKNGRVVVELGRLRTSNQASVRFKFGGAGGRGQ